MCRLLKIYRMSKACQMTLSLLNLQRHVYVSDIRKSEILMIWTCADSMRTEARSCDFMWQIKKQIPVFRKRDKNYAMCKNTLCSVLLFVIVQLLCKSYSLPTHLVTGNGVWSIEVPYGENVVLQCQSNDDDHNFEFWVVENQQVVIGPSNTGYDIRKFRYGILSGNLTIKVSSDWNNNRDVSVEIQWSWNIYMNLF